MDPWGWRCVPHARGFSPRTLDRIHQTTRQSLVDLCRALLVGNGNRCIRLHTRGLLGVTTPRAAIPASRRTRFGQGSSVQSLAERSLVEGGILLLSSSVRTMFEEPLVTFSASRDALRIDAAPILVDSADYPGIHHAGRNLADDFNRVTKKNATSFRLVDAHQPATPDTSTLNAAIIIGSLDSSWIIEHLEQTRKIDTSSIRGKWESFITAVVDNPIDNCTRALVIAGSDKRAAIFGAYTLSSQIGVSPYAHPHS